MFLILILVLISGNVAPALAQVGALTAQPGPDWAAYQPGRLLVRLEEGVSINAGGRLLAEYGAQYLDTIYGSPVQIWQVPEGQELALAQQLSAEAEVRYAEPDYVYTAFNTIPNDSHYNKQWSHSKTNAPQAWDLATGSSDIIIAIVDTGVDLGHPDLVGKLVPGYDVYNNDANPLDDNGHGTHVAGIAAANTNNGTGVAGVSWGARLMPVKALNNQGSGNISHITAGIYWAYQNGADIINLSLGGSVYSQSMQDAVNAAHSAGSLVVAAMGNCRTAGDGCPVANPVMYPAGLNNVFAVASTGPTDAYAPYSQYGSHCDVAAPGGAMEWYQDPDGIYSTMPTYDVLMTTVGFAKNYDFVHGTSQATPYVAGLGALVWSYAPWLTADQVQAAIEDSAVDLGAPGWDVNYGHGRVNAYAALASIPIQPDAPALNTISNPDGDGNYLVDWNTVNLANSYVLQEDDNISFTSPQQVYSGASSQYSITGRGGGSWYYRVKAVNQAGSSAWSNTRSVTVKPAAPSLSTITNPSNQDAYLLDWSETAGAQGYLLQEDDNNTFSSPITRYTGVDSQYQVTGQASGNWYYRVQAFNAGGESAWSSVRATSVAAHLYLPPAFNPINNPDNLDTFILDWQTVPLTATYTYSLELSREAYFVQPQMIYTGTETVYTATVPDAGYWYFRVRVTGPGGDSAWSETVSTNVAGRVMLPLLVGNAGPSMNPVWETLLTENFEGLFPGSLWTLTDSFDGYGEYLWAKRACRPHLGSLSGLGAGGGADGAGLNCGDDYPDNVKAWMFAGPYDLRDAQAVELQYHHWINLEYGETADPILEYDWLCYMYSDDGSWFSGYCFSGNSSGWSEKVFNLMGNLVADLEDLDQVWFGFYFKTDGSVHYAEGAYLDDVQIRKCTQNCSLGMQAQAEEQGVRFEIELSP
ncbi:MAG: peptidase S8 [Anaerolineales bacterium]|nr:peptidase S8 [Anaerolineales bacterium]